MSPSHNHLAMPHQQVSSEEVKFELSCPQPNGNGYPGFPISLDYGVSVLQTTQQKQAEASNDHLIEFSEAMRTVGKALRRVAEGKVSAQAEAAEWKRKYELEKAKNLQQNQKGGLLKDEQRKSLEPHSSNGRIERVLPEDGICVNEILWDEATQPKSFLTHNRVEKVPFVLSWGSTEKKSGQHKHEIVSFENGNITTVERSSKQISLKWGSQPQTVLVLTKPNSTSVRVLCAEMICWLKDCKGMDVVVEPRVKFELLEDGSYFDFVRTWDHDEENLLMHSKLDLVITLGGDGTVLWAASLFKGPVPPVVPFSLGSLGFMTPFQSENYRDCLERVLTGPIGITLRQRLQCHVIRDATKNELETEDPILVLNEVTIDRGISSFLSNLECYCDGSFVTCVQGDGLLISTTSGSTAYSLAAGGSMVHPQVPGILFTPICPHSLSFRPLILPEYVTLRIQVPFNSRGCAWASFDGKSRKQLSPGDALICSIARWPVPTACLEDSTNDFLHSIHDGLHWNLRKSQSFDGPKDA